MSKQLSTIRSEIYMIQIYLFAIVSHVIMFIIFFLLKINSMFFINIFSISLYILTLLFANNSKNARFIRIMLCVIEVFVHQTFAIICLGSGLGFQYYFIILALVIILQSKNIIKTKIKLVSCAVIITTIIFLELYAFIHNPIYALTDNNKIILHLSNIIIAISGITAFAFKQWNVSEQKQLQIEHLLSERNNKIYNMKEKIIQNFADIIEKRDDSTGGHIKRTKAYVEAIIFALVENNKYPDIITPSFSRMGISAAPLHDIGKISISDAILCKKGKLTDEEYEIMKTHSSIGGNMLEDLLGDLESEEYVNIAMDISRYHHEKWNGEGYPSGLKGSNIPLSARIMAVADVFDALTSERVYKDKFSIEKAFEIMESESGNQFDPVIISEFLRIKPRIIEIHNNLSK